MSQAGINNTSNGPVPPEVATSYPTDLGDEAGELISPGLAIPDNNQLFLLSNSDYRDDADGIAIITIPNNSENVEITLMSRLTSRVSTTDDTPTVLVTFPLIVTIPANPTLTGMFNFVSNVCVYNQTSNLGASYNLFVGIRITSGTATKVDAEEVIVNEEAGMEDCEIEASTSGSNLLITVTGLSGENLIWSAVTTYNFVESV